MIVLIFTIADRKTWEIIAIFAHVILQIFPLYHNTVTPVIYRPLQQKTKLAFSYEMGAGDGRQGA